MTDQDTGLFQDSSDEALLYELTNALRPPPLTPSPSSVAALQRAVEQKWKPTGPSSWVGQLAAWARRWQRTGAALAVVGGVAVGGTGVALAASRSVPPPVRDTLHDLGIPVLSWSGDDHASRHPAHSSLTVRLRSASRRSSATPAPGGAAPVVHTAVLQVILAPARPPRRDASGEATTAPPGSSSPAPSAAASARPEIRPSTPPTTRTSTFDPRGTCGWVGPSPSEVVSTSPPAPPTLVSSSRTGLAPSGVTAPVPPSPTATRTAWPRPAGTMSWQTESRWPQTNGRAYPTSTSMPPATRTTSWSSSYMDQARDGGFSSPTSRDRRSGYTRGW